MGHSEGGRSLLHGSGPGATGWANFNRNVGPLVDAGYRVLLIDCPGWGKSDTIVNIGSRADLNARVVKGVIEQLGLAKIHLVGNSMGGHSAAAFALEYPDHVGKLVLMGGGVSGPSIFTPTPTEGVKRLRGLYVEPTLENLKRFNEVFVFDPAALTDDLLQARLANMNNRPDHLENFLKSVDLNPNQFPDLGLRLGEICAPTLVIWGRQDRVLPWDIGLKILAGIPNSELHIYNRCGHWAQWEHADKFNRMVIDFLDH